jgi:hypothetical protein
MRTRKVRSHSSVPNSADPAFDGIQYRSSPGSRNAFTDKTRAPRRRASCRYFVVTGWSFAGLAPRKTIKSASYQSLYEHVVAATPTVLFKPLVDGEWHSRAELSTSLLPRYRITFCAT